MTPGVAWERDAPKRTQPRYSQDGSETGMTNATKADTHSHAPWRHGGW